MRVVGIQLDYLGAHRPKVDDSLGRAGGAWVLSPSSLGPDLGFHLLYGPGVGSADAALS